MTDTICIPRHEYVRLKEEVKTLRNTSIYKRLLQFEENIKSKAYTRKDLGF